MTRRIVGAALVCALTACGGEMSSGPPDAGPELVEPPVYASEVLDFVAGGNAGYGQDKLPNIVLGGPRSPGPGAGSTHVLSLGIGGEIILGFEAKTLFDGPGADFVVFENPFTIAGPPGVFAELAEVSVSTDAVNWHTFACDASNLDSGSWPGCAGWQIVLDFDVENMEPLDPELIGGDAFDLADVGLQEAKFVRIRDLSTQGDAPTAGFDLDAVGAVHLR